MIAIKQYTILVRLPKSKKRTVYFGRDMVHLVNVLKSEMTYNSPRVVLRTLRYGTAYSVVWYSALCGQHASYLHNVHLNVPKQKIQSMDVKFTRQLSFIVHRS